MTQAQLIATQGPPVDEMARLHHAGFSLLPLGAGDDGKGPMASFKGVERLPLGRVLAPMHRSGSQCYGIRLNGLAVIDCDEDSAELVTEMEMRFGASPVHVTTPRGRHLYYSADNQAFPNLRKEGFPVDIKRGGNSYVMGPGSVRPDGGAYIAATGSLGSTSLPRILCGPSASFHRIAEGGRNYRLTVEAVQMVEAVDTPAELFGNLQFLRDEECENPDTIPDDELEKIADWAWSCRLEGKVYHGRNSAFRVHREAIDALRGFPNASDAIALFVTLQDQHGHIPAREIILNHSAMANAGHTDLSRERFLQARRALEAAGLLQIVKNHSVGRRQRTYRLTRLRGHLPTNVSQMRPNKGGGV